MSLRFIIGWTVLCTTVAYLAGGLFVALAERKRAGGEVTASTTLDPGDITAVNYGTDTRVHCLDRYCVMSGNIGGDGPIEIHGLCDTKGNCFVESVLPTDGGTRW